MKENLKIAIEAAINAGRKTLKYYYGDVDVMKKSDDSPLTLADLESDRIIAEALKETEFPVLSEENANIHYSERSQWKTFWLVDPLDGTKEFINKRSEYTINIALVEDGTPVMGVVYVPVQNELYFGSKDEGSFKAIPGEKIATDEIINVADKLPLQNASDEFRVVASRSHLSDETKDFITQLQDLVGKCEMKSYGSSLKLCMVAEGSADVYPRIGPTMEWDTAASQAVAEFAGCKVKRFPELTPLDYNKEDLLNPYFIVYKQEFETVVKNAIAGV